MDISSITASTNSVVIRHPATSEPIGLTIRLLPATSDPVKQVQRRLLNENLRTRGKSLTAEKVEANRLDVLIAATEGWDWENDANFHGEKPDATPVNFRKVYKEVQWIRDQVDDALGDDAAFFRGVDGKSV